MDLDVVRVFFIVNFCNDMKRRSNKRKIINFNFKFEFIMDFCLLGVEWVLVVLWVFVLLEREEEFFLVVLFILGLVLMLFFEEFVEGVILLFCFIVGVVFLFFVFWVYVVICFVWVVVVNWFVCVGCLFLYWEGILILVGGC